ncbi:TIGR04002 family protein [Butyrivibrio sp. WCD3002]|uniref:TIGR04002 family protein n=1 Tax=Butyrivibrio sp. WCD3002 TaxID=1280676 RepID=UPI0003FB4F96|nr:TIGR04002 family protein [Butyrivibrio sp. WCD3002]
MKNRNSRIYNLTLTGAFAALITIFTAYIGHIPVGVNGGYVHFGDTIIYLAATILPMPYAMVAGAIGGGVADLLTAPAWTLATVIIKALLVIPFTNKGANILNKRNYIAPVIAYFISHIGYFIAEAIMFGFEAALLSGLTGGLVQSGGSMIFFILLGQTFDRINLKSKVEVAHG